MDFRWNISRKVKSLVRLLNVIFNMGVVPMDWRGACIVALYKGRVTKVHATREVLVECSR